MNIWSYSIFGTDTEKYYKPMLRNFQIAKENDVQIIISVKEKDEKFVRNYFFDYQDYFILEVINEKVFNDFPKMMRYIISKKYSKYNIFYKDSDSIVTDDEINLMNHWLENENTDFLIIRNHPVHLSPILAGMFAVKAPKISFFVELIENFFNEKYLSLNSIKLNNFDYDQVFLQMEVYSLIINNSSIYSSHFYFCEEKIKKIKFNSNFIGKQVYQENSENQDEWYFKIYSNKMLCLPYIHKLYRYYKDDKIILILAKLFDLFIFKKI